MEYLVLAVAMGLFIFFAIRKFKNASKGKSCCK